MADLRPYVDESEEISSLRSNSSQLGEDDGDRPIQPVEDHVTVLSQVQKSSIAKEVQMQVRNALDLSDSEGCSHPGIGPVLSGLWSLIQEGNSLHACSP